MFLEGTEILNRTPRVAGALDLYGPLSSLCVKQSGRIFSLIGYILVYVLGMIGFCTFGTYRTTERLLGI